MSRSSIHNPTQRTYWILYKQINRADVHDYGCINAGQYLDSDWFAIQTFVVRDQWKERLGEKGITVPDEFCVGQDQPNG